MELCIKRQETVEGSEVGRSLVMRGLGAQRRISNWTEVTRAGVCEATDSRVLNMLEFISHFAG